MTIYPMSVYEMKFILATNFYRRYRWRHFENDRYRTEKTMVQGNLRGRPPLDPGVAKRASFNTRLRPALKLALETAAKQEGRSLSEEIEFRLEQSLDDERHLADALELVAYDLSVCIL